MLRRLFVSQKHAYKYVASNSRKLSVLDDLNAFYNDVIEEQESIQQLANSYSYHVQRCESLNEFRDCNSDYHAFLKKLRSNSDLMAAFRIIYEFNLKAESYKYVADNTLYGESAYDKVNKHIVSLDKFKEIENDVYCNNILLQPIEFNIKFKVRYSKYYFFSNISFQKLIIDLGINKINFEGVGINDFLSDNVSNDDISGCYLLYNHTFSRLYIGYSDCLYKTVYDIFNEESDLDSFLEYKFGCEFYIGIRVMAENDDKSIHNTLNYLGWCYKNNHLQIKFLDDVNGKMTA